MKITNFELNINSVADVKKGRIAPSSVNCAERRSDCFVYVLSGEADYFFDNNVFTAKTGNVIFLAEHSTYSINVTDENYTFIFVDFYFEKERDIIFENMIYCSKSMMLLNNCFEKLYNIWCFGDFADKIYCKALLYEIYSKITKQSLSTYISPIKKQQLENIVEYIYSNIGDSDLSVTTLSKLLSISEVHFRRLFFHAYHTSPIKFITSTRVNKAKELLLNEEYSISVIAEKCGFQNHYYFSKVFRDITNMTPTGYRKLYK